MRKFLAVAVVTVAGMLASFGFAQQNETLTEQGRLEQAIRDYLLAHPEVIVEALEKFQAEQDKLEAATQAQAIVERREQLNNAPGTPVLGNVNGDVTIVEFFDYRCPYCKQVATGLMETVEADGNVRLVLKEFPILGEASQFAARAALAAHKQGKYRELHLALMAFKGQMSESDVRQAATDAGLDMAKFELDLQAADVVAEINDNHQLGEAIGVRGTPAFVIGDELIPGALGPDEMRRRIAAARQG